MGSLGAACQLTPCLPFLKGVLGLEDKRIMTHYTFVKYYVSGIMQSQCLIFKDTFTCIYVYCLESIFFKIHLIFFPIIRKQIIFLIIEEKVIENKMEVICNFTILNHYAYFAVFLATS